MRTYADASVDLVLIGNKSDLDGERAVEERQGKDLADEYNIPFIETSAKDGSNVNQAFALLVESVYIRVLEKKMKDASRRMQEGAGGSVSSYNSAGGNKNSRRITLGSGDRKQSRKEKMMNKCCK